MIHPAFHLAVIVACMLGEAFHSGMETGVISIHRLRLRHLLRARTPGARTLQNFLDNPDRLFGTTLVGTNICAATSAIMAASLASAFLGTLGQALSTAAMTVLLVTFCEYLPKAWFQSRPLRRSLRFVGALRVSSAVLRPLAMIVTGISRLIVPRGQTYRDVRAPFVTRDELKMLAREVEQNGVLSPQERQMVHKVFELSAKTAGQIMVPREKMATVRTDARVPELLDTARAAGVTRMPVYDEREARFTGILNIFDIFSAPAAAAQGAAAQYMRPARFISSSMPVDEVLPQMRMVREPMCLVTNEESQVVGLLSAEDVLEEIVGEL